MFIISITNSILKLLTMILPILSLFALIIYIIIELTKNNEQKNKEMIERIQHIAEVYVDNDNPRHRIDSGLTGLLTADILSVKSDYETRQVILLICNRDHKNLFGKDEAVLSTVNLLEFFKIAAKKNLGKTTATQIIEELKSYKK